MTRIYGAIAVGSVVEVRPAFDSFGEEIDQLGHCVGRVINMSDDGQYADVVMRNGDEWNIWVNRLRSTQFEVMQ